MKMQVAKEGEPFGDGRLIRPGALFCVETLIPAMTYENMDEIVGAARDLQRGDDGVVNMDVVLFEYAQTFVDLKLREATVLIQPFEAVGEEGNMEITKGQIREIVLTRRDDARGIDVEGGRVTTYELFEDMEQTSCKSALHFDRVSFLCELPIEDGHIAHQESGTTADGAAYMVSWGSPNGQAHA
jgi:hypothetical protein